MPVCTDLWSVEFLLRRGQLACPLRYYILCAMLHGTCACVSLEWLHLLRLLLLAKASLRLVPWVVRVVRCSTLYKRRQLKLAQGRSTSMKHQQWRLHKLWFCIFVQYNCKLLLFTLSEWCTWDDPSGHASWEAVNLPQCHAWSTDCAAIASRMFVTTPTNSHGHAHNYAVRVYICLLRVLPIIRNTRIAHKYTIHKSIEHMHAESIDCHLIFIVWSVLIALEWATHEFICFLFNAKRPYSWWSERIW